MISAIFACTFREAIISVLTERAPLRRSLNRAEKEKELRALISRRRGDHTDTLRYLLKFVQEVDGFVTSRFKKIIKKMLWWSKKALNLAKLATLRASLLTSHSV